MKTKKKKVLFICTHNSIRSHMAEGLVRAFFGDFLDVFSAGTEPSAVNPNAIRVMKEIGIDISNQYAKSVNQFLDTKFDYVVTLCDHARETCPFFPGGIITHKSFKDPSQVQGSDEEVLFAFRKSREEIKNWIEEVCPPRTACDEADASRSARPEGKRCL